jgi:glycerophosphoryl diester phosphodiesterase
MIDLRRGDGRPLLIGHRGAAALAPPNSLDALRVAVEAGVDGVEVDVLRSRSGRLVLAHGPEVPDVSPSLDEALALVAELGVFVQLDVKLTGAASEIAAAVGSAGLGERAFASSFSQQALLELRRAAPELPRAYTYPERPQSKLLRGLLPRRLPAWLDAVGAAGAVLKQTVTTPAVVRACHEHGAAVLVWTVNDPGIAVSLAEMGVDAIITDDPRTAPGGIDRP